MQFSFVRPTGGDVCPSSIAEGRLPAKKKIRILRGIALLSGALFLGGCGGGLQKKAAVYSATDTAMGTVVSMTLYSGALGEEALEETRRELFREVCRLETEVLSKRLESSELYRAQETADPEGTVLSEELRELLQSCREVSELSQGAFTVTIGALTKLWNMDEQALLGQSDVPGQEEISAALAACGEDKIRLEDGRLFLSGGVCLDLGAVGKGYALDRIREKLDGAQISGVFSLGGSVLTYGTKPDGSCWRVAVADPFQTGGTIGWLELDGTWCVSTSGDYERFFERDGVRYHHILDPETGYPARSGLRSVTILSESGTLSDALSTACFVLGKERGTALAERFGAEILCVGEDGEIRCSAGMERIFHGTGK